MKITIIWGTAGFWLWTAQYIKKHLEQAEITVTWRNVERGTKVANENNFKFTNDNKEAVKDADVTIFSVPIAYMEETIKELAPLAKKGSMLIDVCSIKGFPAQTMKKYSQEWVFILPTHPMFWPYIEEIAGQIFVLTPLSEEDKQDERYILIKNFLEKQGAKVIETTPEKHDKMMAVVQWLTHINMFTVWETIKRMGISVEESLDFVSPIYKLMIASVARYIWHDPKLYWDIQMYNPEVLKVHDKFMEVIKDFNKAVQDKDEEKFIEIIQWTKNYFWKEAKKFGQNYTDKIIYLMTEQIREINENIWKKLKFKNIHNQEIVEWVIKKVDNNILDFTNWTKIDINKYIITDNNSTL